MSLAAEYAAHLARQDEAVQAFVDLLQRERDALAAQPVAYPALAQLTEAKSQQAEALESLERARRELADAARADSGVTDAELAAQLGCGELWARMSARVAQARNQNAINGVAINTRLDHTEARLDFLRRHASGSLYAANGRRSPSTGGGRLRGDA
ncbi:flagella synthesis protein FlgN [Salinisphaera sp. LB1]|uniref:flagella synthesis protein FlgN n=1 Tax=Salinisphaera sp. LB1 TaxID=2183911 RepID=UPI000D705B1A|nr:flagellar protein FlgN [Salinisphaera sp. LB1]AWN16014.1 Flagellar biosynthesis protein FlgN [Salinisphaera sp. LB1]